MNLKVRFSWTVFAHILSLQPCTGRTLKVAGAEHTKTEKMKFYLFEVLLNF